MNKALFATAAVLLGTALPAAAFAQTYEYVNTNGIIESVSANTADQALVLAPDIAPHSGVMLVETSTVIPAVNTPVDAPAATVVTSGTTGTTGSMTTTGVTNTSTGTNTMTTGMASSSTATSTMNNGTMSTTTIVTTTTPTR